MLEKLEVRRFLDAELFENTLFIRGTPFGDDVQIEQTGNLILISIQPESFTQQFNLSQIRRFDVELDEGNDLLEMDHLITRSATVRGGDGDDTITTASGNDSLDGGEGNDLLNGGFDLGLSRDVYVGGLGFDVVDFRTQNRPLKIDFDGDDDDGIRGERDNVTTTIEGVLGGGAADVITSNLTTGVTIQGNAGNDTINTSGGDDRITGGRGNDFISTRGGDDFLAGGAGRDTLIGGTGVDTASWFDTNRDVNLSIDGISNDGETGESDQIGTDIENLEGGGGDDTITGSAGPNVLTGGGGRDRINGLAGDDVLNGNDENDTLDGGLGNDTMDGGTGSDRFAGGGGTDTATYRTRGQRLIVTVNNVANDGAANERDDVRTDVEIIEGGFDSDSITGSALANTLLGGAGNDTLVGGAGNDQMDGGPGNDDMDGQAGSDVFFGGPGTGDIANFSARTTPVTVDVDDVALDGSPSELDNVLLDVEVVIGGSAGDTLVGRSGNQRLFGRAGNDTLLGGAGNDALEGGDGDDLLNGEGNNDDLRGGAGIDTVDYSLALSDVTITLDNMADDGGMGETDNVRADIEVLIGGPLDDEIEGAAGPQTVIGGAGNDTIDGMSGDDSLDGGIGDDSLIGGTGNDTLIGGIGNDIIRAIDLVEDTIDGGLGTDQAFSDFVDQVLNVP